MGELVNLNRYRKQRDRDEKIRQASENRTRFGRTKTEKLLDSQETGRLTRDLDGKKLDDPA